MEKCCILDRNTYTQKQTFGGVLTEGCKYLSCLQIISLSGNTKDDLKF